MLRDRRALSYASAIHIADVADPRGMFGRPIVEVGDPLPLQDLRQGARVRDGGWKPPRLYAIMLTIKE